LLGPLKTWTRTTSFVGKDVLEVVRRPGALFSLIFGPFLIMGLFGLGYSGQYRPLDTVLVLPADSNLPTDMSFYQQYLGDSVNLVQITSDADAARAELQRQQIDLLALQLGACGIRVGRDLDEVHGIAQVLLVKAGVSGQVRIGGQHQDCVERPILAAVPEAKQTHDQKWAEDQTEEGARPPKDLYNVLDDERRGARPGLKRPEQ
jgi:hypothetical protein